MIRQSDRRGVRFEGTLTRSVSEGERFEELTIASVAKHPPSLTLRVSLLRALTTNN